MILLWSLRDLLLLLFAAVVLAMALCTLVGILRERRPMQRPLALALCIFGLLLLVAGAAGVVVPPFLEEFSLLLQKLPEAGQTLVRYHLPLIRGGMLTAAMIVFVDCMKELPATLLLRPFNFDTLATHVYEFASDEMLGEASLGSLTIVGVGLIPVVLLSRMVSRTRQTLGESAGQT